jgi:hypothetical protein
MIIVQHISVKDKEFIQLIKYIYYVGYGTESIGSDLKSTGVL